MDRDLGNEGRHPFRSRHPQMQHLGEESSSSPDLDRHHLLQIAGYVVHDVTRPALYHSIGQCPLQLE